MGKKIVVNLNISGIVHEFETLFSMALFMDKPSIQELITQESRNID